MKYLHNHVSLLFLSSRVIPQLSLDNSFIAVFNITLVYACICVECGQCSSLLARNVYHFRQDLLQPKT